jgi:hypothetical protein
MIRESGYYSYLMGQMAKGCRLCVQGKKLVLFVTGLCSRNCYYCPISDKKKNHDVIYANEWPVKNFRDIIKETELCAAKGVGITGGDPLIRLERTVKIMRLLKKSFGKKFHIHLYTPLLLVTEEKLKKLYKAGLDEIRFHPDIDNTRDWHKITLATAYDWDVGVEIPVIPGKEKVTKALIDFLTKANIKFLNLNELEISDAKACKLAELGFTTKNALSYGIMGSDELAKRLLKYAMKTRLNVHYCTITLKDKVQLAKRIKRRALHIAKEYDMISREGILTRGAIYLKEIKPGVGYRKRLEKAGNRGIVRRLEYIKKELIKDCKIPKTMIEIDKNKLRLLTSAKIIKKNKPLIKEKSLVPAIVEEYPTYDQLELSVEFL